MFKSEYLFGFPRSKYEPEQTKLANDKIADGQTMLRRLAFLRDSTEAHHMEELIQRYKDVEEAIGFWRKIKET